MKESNLFVSAKAFIEMYEKSFGAPEKECVEFLDLKRAIKRIEQKNKCYHKRYPGKAPLVFETLAKRLRLCQMLLSNFPFTYGVNNEGGFICECRGFRICVALSNEGCIRLVAIGDNSCFSYETKKITEITKNLSEYLCS
jgi:hypothetical protein